MNKVSKTFNKNLEKYVWMDSFLEPVALLKWTFSEVFFKDFV